MSKYLDDVANTSEEDAVRMLKEARDYNERLLMKSDRFRFTKEELNEYNGMLSSESGVMGILMIDKIETKLPIYHGTDESVLQVGLGHMEGTSLPVGGKGTHSFITGHRGLPSSKLLSNLDEVAEGDLFMIYVLGEVLTYKVDEIRTVEPEEVGSTGIEPEQDFVTMVTCTPYGVNSHRLLVRGHRIENNADSSWERPYAEAKVPDKFSIILIFIVPVLLILIIYLVIKCIKIHKEGGKNRQ